MPVHKFHSVEEMPADERGDIRDPRYRASIHALLAMTLTFSPRWPRRGVFKHESVEAAGAARREWERESARARLTATPG